jgi:valyl-tRNA synthetase
MNERIRKLAGSALDKAVPETWTTLTAYDLNKFAEVFAELIVRECCDMFVELRTRPADWAAKDVKKHFGVDE